MTDSSDQSREDRLAELFEYAIELHRLILDVDPNEAALTGQRVGRYRIIERIGLAHA